MGEELPGTLLPGMVDDLVGIALFHDHAAIHEDHLVRHIPGKGHLMGHNDHCGFLLRQVPDHPQHFAGKLGIQSGGGLVKAKDVRVQRQGTGNSHTLLLTTRELMRIMARPVRQAHLGQKLPASSLDLLLGLAAPLLGEELPGQRHVLKGRVLGEEVEVLEHQAEVEPLFPDLAFQLRLGVRCVKEGLAPDGNGTAVGLFQEIQAPQQRGLAAAGGADDRDGLPLLQGKADVIEHLGGTEVLFNVFDFQNGHFGASLTEIAEFLLHPAEEQRQCAVEDQIVYAGEKQRPQQSFVAVGALQKRVARPDDLLQ